MNDQTMILIIGLSVVFFLAFLGLRGQRKAKREALESVEQLSAQIKFTLQHKDKNSFKFLFQKRVYEFKIFKELLKSRQPGHNIEFFAKQMSVRLISPLRFDGEYSIYIFNLKYFYRFFDWIAVYLLKKGTLVYRNPFSWYLICGDRPVSAQQIQISSGVQEALDFLIFKWGSIQITPHKIFIKSHLGTVNTRTIEQTTKFLSTAADFFETKV